MLVIALSILIGIDGGQGWQVLFASFNHLSFELFCGHQILLLMVSDGHCSPINN